MIETRQHSSIAEIPREAWDALWPGDAEGWAYYRCCEQAMPAGFAVSYLATYADVALVAAAPVFHTHYELYSSVRGPVRSMLDAIARRFPSFLRLGVTGLGSPLVDRCHIGLREGFTPEQRSAVLGSLLDGLAQSAGQNAHRLIAVKDLEDGLAVALEGDLQAHGFAKVRSLPNAYLDLPFGSWEAFLKSLSSPSARSYLKRKERGLSRLRVEFPEEIGALSPRLHALYEQTRTQSQGDYGVFEDLDPMYFDEVKRACGDRAQFMLCWLDDRLVSFQLLLAGDRELIGKLIGMDYTVARDLNLYFVNLNQAIRLAIARGIPHVRMGNTAYGVKMIYGARLVTHWINFKHRNAGVNWLLRKLAPLIDYERNDPELAKMRQQEAGTKEAAG